MVGTVLGASNFTYAEASWTQALADWIGAQEHSYISPHRIRHLLTEAAIALDFDLG